MTNIQIQLDLRGATDRDRAALAAIVLEGLRVIDGFHVLRSQATGNVYREPSMVTWAGERNGFAAIQLALDLPDTAQSDHFAPMQLLLETMTRVDLYQIQRARAAGRPYPHLYSSGVRYREEAPGREDWPDVGTILANGWGDCDDLAPWRAAELRDLGVAAESVIKWREISAAQLKKAGWPAKLARGGAWLVHCLVRYPDGKTTEDPSKLLGMGAANSPLQRI